MAEFWYDPEVGEGSYWPLAKIIHDLIDIAVIAFLIFVLVATVRFMVVLVRHFFIDRKKLDAKIRQEIDRALFTIILCISIPAVLIVFLWMWKK